MAFKLWSTNKTDSTSNGADRDHNGMPLGIATVHGKSVSEKMQGNMGQFEKQFQKAEAIIIIPVPGAR